MLSYKNFLAVILGPPGAGKGTISERIVSKCDCIHLAIGDILRRNIDEKTDLGLVAKKYIDSGKLVPDDVIIKTTLQQIKVQKNNSILLDGFPRTAQQAELLHQANKPDFVINLKVPTEVIVERVQGRWIHLRSGRVYNVGFNPPKIPFKDDVTGEDLVQRNDDKPDIVRKRMNIYWNEIEPILEFYRDQNILHDFAGNKTNEIWPKISKFLDEKCGEMYVPVSTI